MTTHYIDGEVLSGVQRRWISEGEVWIVESTYLPGLRVPLIAGLPIYGYSAYMLCYGKRRKDRARRAQSERVYRVAKVLGLLLRQDSKRREELHHDGRCSVLSRILLLIAPSLPGLNTWGLSASILRKTLALAKS